MKGVFSVVIDWPALPVCVARGLEADFTLWKSLPDHGRVLVTVSWSPHVGDVVVVGGSDLWNLSLCLN